MIGSELINVGHIDFNMCPYIPEFEHYIHCGMYYRKTKVKAGSMIVGCGHKFGSISILLSGKIMQVDGENKYEAIAPFTTKTEPNSKRYAIAIEDSEYLTVTRTDCTDLSIIEKELYEEPSINEYVRNDYKQLLIESNLAQKDVENDMNSIDVDYSELDGVDVRESSIDGEGVFTSQDFLNGEVIGVAYENNIKTILGRKVNHSPMPNCFYINNNGSIELVALYNISNDIELTVNYRQKPIDIGE